MNSIKVCEYSRSRSFHDDLILQDQASGERSQDHWSSGLFYAISIITVHSCLFIFESHLLPAMICETEIILSYIVACPCSDFHKYTITLC